MLMTASACLAFSWCPTLCSVLSMVPAHSWQQLLRGRPCFSPHLTREGRELRGLHKTTQQVAEPDSDPNLPYSRLQSLDPEEWCALNRLRWPYPQPPLRPLHVSCDLLVVVNPLSSLYVPLVWLADLVSILTVPRATSCLDSPVGMP